MTKTGLVVAAAAAVLGLGALGGCATQADNGQLAVPSPALAQGPAATYEPTAKDMMSCKKMMKHHKRHAAHHHAKKKAVAAPAKAVDTATTTAETAEQPAEAAK